MTSALPETLSKMVSCEVCDAKVTSHKILKAHIKNKHNNENKTNSSSKASCDVCDYETPNKASLSLHKRKEHRDSDKKTEDKKEEKVKVESRLKDIHKVTPHPAKKRKSLEKIAKIDIKPKSKTLEELVGIEKKKDRTPLEEAFIWLCEDCKVSFPNKQGLEEHMEEKHRHESMKTLYSCSECPMTFSSEDEMREHCNFAQCNLATKSTDPTELPEQNIPHETTEPSNTTTTPKPINNLESTTHPEPLKLSKPEPSTKCDLCDRIFNSYVGLCTHKRFKHGAQKRKKYECDSCEVRLVSGPALVEHMKSKHGKEEELSVKCSPPQKKIKEDSEARVLLENRVATLEEYCRRLESLLREKDEGASKTKVPDKIAQDETQEEEFKLVRRRRNKQQQTVIDMNVSEAVSEAIEPHPCKNCTGVFETETELRNHENKYHKEEEEEEDAEESSWTCTGCDFQSNVMEDFAKHCIETGHENCHHDSKCKTCKQTFPTYDAVIEHRRVEHPSTKKCKDFRNCPKGDTCLYIHEEQNMEVETVNPETTQTPENPVTPQV